MGEIENKQKAFKYKLGAAKYHLGRLKEIFKEHRQLFFKITQNPKKHTPTEIMPFFYHYDAFLYELSSCFDMVLQYLCIRHKLQIAEKDIGWNKKYKKELEKKCASAHKVISSEYEEWWFEDLRAARNYITHYDSPGLGVEFTDKGITLLFFYIPGLHQRREMFEQCDIWGSNISKLYQAIENID